MWDGMERRGTVWDTDGCLGCTVLRAAIKRPHRRRCWGEMKTVFFFAAYPALTRMKVYVRVCGQKRMYV